MANNYGEEDFYYVTQEHYNRALKYHYRGLMHLLKLLYFNPRHPENHTITYKEQYPTQLCIREDGEWRPITKEYVLDEVIVTIWTKMYDAYLSLEKNNKLEALCRTFVCSETRDRLESFIDDFTKVCNGNTVIMADTRKDLFNFIVRICTKPTTSSVPQIKHSKPRVQRVRKTQDVTSIHPTPLPTTTL